MKKIFALLALVLGVVSCQTEPEGLDVNVGGEQEVMLTVSLPETTRANSAVGAFANVDWTLYTIRYQMEVYDSNGRKSDAVYEQCLDGNVGNSVVFPVRLVPNRDYRFVVWADIVKDADKTDLHYSTADLTNITLKGEWKPMDETRDAFTGYFDTVEKGKQYTSTSSINITLKRPFAKLRVITTDMEALRNLGIEPPFFAEVEYATEYRAGFNAFTSKAVEAVKDVKKTHAVFEIANYDDNTDANKVLFTDYFFAEEDVVKFTLNVYEGVNANGEGTGLIKSNIFNTDIAAKRNYLTTIQGNILTDGNNVTVEVKDAFANANNPTEKPYYYQTISSEAELLTAIENGGEYIVISDINVTGLVASTQAATRTTGTTTPTTTTINLNGYTITLNANVEIPAEKTVIINNEPVDNAGDKLGAVVNDGGKIINNGTLNIEGGAFGANTIENNNGEVNITGGTFESNPSDFVDDDYEVVKNEENGEFTLVQKDEAVEINGTTYRSIKKAVAAAQNGDTVVFIADVEQADGVVITDKNITIDLGDYTFTVTEGANTNNRNFKVDGSSVVTIKNGTMVAQGDITSGAYGTLRTEGSANVTLENVELYNYRGNGLNVKAYSGTTVTINNSEIYSQYGGGVEAAGGTVELTNVKIEQKGMYTAPYNSMAISVNGGGTATVNSGTYSTECIKAEDANNQGTSHGPWCAGVLNSGGTLIIKGGTFSNDNFGDNALATAARGLLLADTGANIQIEGGTFNAVKKIIDIQNNLGDASKNPTATISGGDFSSNPLTWDGLISVAKGLFVVEKNDRYIVKEPDAMVGTTSYGSIDEAIAAWTHNTTLTLMSNVELSDVITLKSTEHHILNLGTYTMTAASGKNAIEITPYGDGAGTAAKSCLTINADATNPGKINAGNKACVYYKKTNGINDRIMVTINGGVFDGTISSSSNNGGQACPYFVFNGGVFNKSINLTKAMLKVTGGVFHGMFSCTGDSTAHRLISGGTFKSFTFMTADAANKFCIGTDKQTYNVGLYVNDEGYLVVGGPVITEFGDKFAAKATNATKWSSYLQYSSAAANGLYYTNADMAIKKHGEANVVLK